MEINRSKEVDAYIALYPKETQVILESIREMIFLHFPDVTEKMSYKMPAYFLKGPLFYYAAYEKHIGFYPTADGIEAFSSRFQSYKWAKGSVQFPLAKPIPYDLIKEIMEYRYHKNKG